MKKFALIFVLILLLAENASAMHLSEGILPLKHSVIFSVISLPFLFYGFRLIKKKKSENPLYFSMVGLIGATVFVLSAFPIPVPIIGTCSHPAGTGLSAIVLGPFQSVVVAFISLLIQALFMAHGGLSTLGANTFTMGVCGSFFGFLAYFLLKKGNFSSFVAGFAAGFVADIATYFFTSFVLAVSIAPEFWQGLLEVSLAFVPTQIPLAILEGLVSGFAIKYIEQHQPAFLTLRIV